MLVGDRPQQGPLLQEILVQLCLKFSKLLLFFCPYHPALMSLSASCLSLNPHLFDWRRKLALSVTRKYSSRAAGRLQRAGKVT